MISKYINILKKNLMTFHSTDWFIGILTPAYISSPYNWVVFHSPYCWWLKSCTTWYVKTLQITGEATYQLVSRISAINSTKVKWTLKWGYPQPAVHISGPMSCPLGGNGTFPGPHMDRENRIFVSLYPTGFPNKCWWYRNPKQPGMYKTGRK